MIDVQDGQRVENARAELADLGVRDDVQVDRLREVGRGVRSEEPSLAQLCGHCGQDKIAVAPDGSVWPCVFARWLPVGNVRDDALADILSGPRMVATASALAGQFGQPHMGKGACNPQCCPSTMCDPQCSPSCSPSCRPAGNCTPKGNCAPNY